MRYPAQALELIKEKDPDSAVTLNLIRTLIRTEALPVVRVGRRQMINVDALLEYLAEPPSLEQQTEECQSNTIRQVPTRLAR
jgi:hypothetical protein